jgi:SAM-dependent methyltransferase
MTHQPPRAVFDANLANYFSEWSLAEYTREEGLWPLERELVSGFMPPPPARLLDLGCGGGRTTVGLVAGGYQVTAIDLAEPLISHARARHPGIDFRVMDATALAFDDGSFEGAIFSYNGIDAIFPLASRARCLGEVFRVLRPGGVFVMSSHNALGHLFSGGFHYLRGYRNAIAMLARQRSNPHLRDWYFHYADPGGAQLLYSGPPQATGRQLRAAGFDVVDVRGASGERRPRRILWRQPHVYFVARKPAR